MKYKARTGKTNFNVSATSVWRELFALVAGVGAVCVVLYLLLGWTVDLVADYVPPRLEARMARILLPRFGPGLEKNGTRQSCLQQLVDRIQARCVDLPYHFKAVVLEDERVNALALPGGTIIVFSGLLERVKSENELAFVLGHEMGHFVNRDHLRRLGRSLVILAVTSLVLGSDSTATGLVANALKFTELHFSRRQEMAADRFGLKVLQCFYGHGCGAVDFFVRMPSEMDPGRIGHYFASHPETAVRIENLGNLPGRDDCPADMLRPLPACLQKDRSGQ